MKSTPKSRVAFYALIPKATLRKINQTAKLHDEPQWKALVRLVKGNR